MNGDFVDRGHGSVEVLLVLLTMKLVYPNYFFLNRGNHEGKGVTMRYGFQEMIQLKYSTSIYTLCLPVFESLPIASVVDQKAFVSIPYLKPRRDEKDWLNINVNVND